MKKIDEWIKLLEKISLELSPENHYRKILSNLIAFLTAVRDVKGVPEKIKPRDVLVPITTLGKQSIRQEKYLSQEEETYNQCIDQFQPIIARLVADLSKKDERIKLLMQSMKDGCGDDTEMRKLAEKVLTKFEIYGDTYGVPTIVGVVELLIDKLSEKDK